MDLMNSLYENCLGTLYHIQVDVEHELFVDFDFFFFLLFQKHKDQITVYVYHLQH